MPDVDASGNILKMFSGGIEHCVELAENYGGAVKLTGLFGEVSGMYNATVTYQPSRASLILLLLLKEFLYLSDPLALYHVLVKEQHIFEESDNFIM
jgi:hypothetical protein